MVRYIFASIAAIFMLSACNTMHGVGQDVEKAGREIKQEAHEHR